MMPLAARLAVAAVVVLAGCRHAPVEPRAEPALIDHPSPAGRAELSRLVGAALNRPPVLLADDALLRDDLLLVERRVRLDAGGVRLDGREMDAPERFHLVRVGNACLLVHERTGRRWSLRQSCTARDAPP